MFNIDGNNKVKIDIKNIFVKGTSKLSGGNGLSGKFFNFGTNS